MNELINEFMNSFYSVALFLGSFAGWILRMISDGEI